jgi:hypothetical protein
MAIYHLFYISASNNRPCLHWLHCRHAWQTHHPSSGKTTISNAEPCQGAKPLANAEALGVLWRSMRTACITRMLILGSRCSNIESVGHQGQTGDFLAYFESFRANSQVCTYSSCLPWLGSITTAVPTFVPGSVINRQRHHFIPLAQRAARLQCRRSCSEPD